MVSVYSRTCFPFSFTLPDKYYRTIPNKLLNYYFRPTLVCLAPHTYARIDTKLRLLLPPFHTATISTPELLMNWRRLITQRTVLTAANSFQENVHVTLYNDTDTVQIGKLSNEY